MQQSFKDGTNRPHGSRKLFHGLVQVGHERLQRCLVFCPFDQLHVQGIGSGLHRALVELDLGRVAIGQLL